MPEAMKEAACAAIHGDINQYAITWGAQAAPRSGSPRSTAYWYDMPVDPEKRDHRDLRRDRRRWPRVSWRVLNPGDEVIIFEPWYENYGPDAILARATPRFVR